MPSPETSFFEEVILTIFGLIVTTDLWPQNLICSSLFQTAHVL